MSAHFADGGLSFSLACDWMTHQSRVAGAGRSRDLREFPIRKGSSAVVALLVRAGITANSYRRPRSPRTNGYKLGLMFWRYLSGIPLSGVARKLVDDR